MMQYVLMATGAAVSFGVGYFTGRHQSVKEYNALLYILDNKAGELVKEVETLKAQQVQQTQPQEGVNP